jgi:hypothetical protein
VLRMSALSWTWMVEADAGIAAIHAAVMVAAMKRKKRGIVVPLFLILWTGHYANAYSAASGRVTGSAVKL